MLLMYQNSYRKSSFETLILKRVLEHYVMPKLWDFGGFAEVFRKRSFLGFLVCLTCKHTLSCVPCPYRTAGKYTEHARIGPGVTALYYQRRSSVDKCDTPRPCGTRPGQRYSSRPV